MVGIDRYFDFAVAINRIHGSIIVQYLHHAMRLNDYDHEKPICNLKVCFHYLNRDRERPLDTIVKRQFT
jgi:hypothetical protein